MRAQNGYAHNRGSASAAARDAALETGMKEGMSESFNRLAEYLRTMA